MQTTSTRATFCADGRNRFYLNSRSGWCICHNCGWATKDFIIFVERFLGLTRQSAEEYVQKSSQRSGPAFQKEAEAPVISLPRFFHPLTLPLQEGAKRYWDYVRGRDILPETILAYGLGYCRLGPYGGRLIVPVHRFLGLAPPIALFASPGLSRAKTPSVCMAFTSALRGTSYLTSFPHSRSVLMPIEYFGGPLDGDSVDLPQEPRLQSAWLRDFRRRTFLSYELTELWDGRKVLIFAGNLPPAGVQEAS